MPVFHVDLRRYVSRVVELRQSASIGIDAPNLETARDAADKLSLGSDLDDHILIDWRDDDDDRFATRDEPVQRAMVWKVCQAPGPKGCDFFADEILNFDPETEE